MCFFAIDEVIKNDGSILFVLVGIVSFVVAAKVAAELWEYVRPALVKDKGLGLMPEFEVELVICFKPIYLPSEMREIIIDPSAVVFFLVRRKASEEVGVGQIGAIFGVGTRGLPLFCCFFEISSVMMI